MQLYKWTGPQDQAEALVESLSKAQFTYLKNDDETVLLYETDEGTGLKASEAYEVLNAVGDFADGHYAVFNNIPVTDEGRELFESRFQNRAGMVEKEPGFAAIRVLRPLDSDVYVILTLWEDKQSFIDWQQSQAYGHAHAKRGTKEGIDKRPNIFPRSSFVTSYTK
ncbi:extracellular polysaccharide biosynthesis protein [Planococcus halocryophilus Or1]|uniref:Antibiotic biosynthesis monooxygenase n=1 Tax=Planococcus halocryophilus TaxID=1215089 RepID=A0A1C7DS09_9BACL|nr:antibiotic biosynthesis monooxygenase [Planococcus halocryophilus]ANU14071.1 antibiotic biosynthesis monooxygenase [Planococcus halocryophilus]EMF47331.1 extracellular polysaccharide biosynthesis protein [Planococcus halocryophilus Or1]